MDVQKLPRGTLDNHTRPRISDIEGNRVRQILVHRGLHQASREPQERSTFVRRETSCRLFGIRTPQVAASHPHTLPAAKGARCFEPDPVWTEEVPPRSAIYAPQPGVWDYIEPESDAGEHCCEVDYADSSTDPQGSTDTHLRTGGCNKKPIAAAYLDHFLELPRREWAYVEPLRLLNKRRVGAPRHITRRRVFDDTYMTDICDALEFWLQGRRDDVELPTVSSDLGELRVEQLAYQKYGKGMYCTGGEEKDLDFFRIWQGTRAVSGLPSSILRISIVHSSFSRPNTTSPSLADHFPTIFFTSY